MERSYSFHLSLVTDNLTRQCAFYTDVLGCQRARTGADFVDIDFFGNQLTFHQRPASLGLPYETLHFGATVSWEEFDELFARLSHVGAHFVILPLLQAADTVDARRKLVVLDPSGYGLELKCYADASRALVQESAYPRPGNGSA